jgi:hypothetical protein
MKHRFIKYVIIYKALQIGILLNWTFLIIALAFMQSALCADIGDTSALTRSTLEHDRQDNGNFNINMTNGQPKSIFLVVGLFGLGLLIGMIAMGMTLPPVFPNDDSEVKITFDFTEKKEEKEEQPQC